MLAAPLLAAALAGQMPVPFVPERDCDYADTPAGRTYHDPFLIFFDWDSSAITPGAAAILDNAASGFGPLWARCGVEIVAHADRSGPAGYNLALSRRRAAAIIAYLRTRGVTAEAKLEGLGETRPLVETADGVREPHNRGAAILVLLPSRR
jgi:outer membrane protein OmpA-like peptidoglycan-associated protein